MNSDSIDELLRAYSKQPLPPPPEGLTTGVWREIDLRRRRPSWLGLFPVLNWRELFAEPRLAAAGLSLALIVGILPATAARSFGQARLARDSLHFDVFSTRSLGTPATLLADRAGMRSVHKLP